jgi:hypothetical protein
MPSFVSRASVTNFTFALCLVSGASLVACGAATRGERAAPVPTPAPSSGTEATAASATPAPAATGVPTEGTSAPTVRTAAQTARDAELAPKAQATLAAYSNRGAQLTAGGLVVFGSDRDGLP